MRGESYWNAVRASKRCLRHNTPVGALSGPDRHGRMNFSALRKSVYVALVVLAVIAMAPAVVLACPACAKALEGTDIGAGFNASILFMLAAPFALVGAVGGGLAYRYRVLSRRVADDDVLSQEFGSGIIASTNKAKEKGV